MVFKIAHSFIAKGVEHVGNAILVGTLNCNKRAVRFIFVFHESASVLAACIRDNGALAGDGGIVGSR